MQRKVEEDTCTNKNFKHYQRPKNSINDNATMNP